MRVDGPACDGLLHTGLHGVALGVCAARAAARAATAKWLAAVLVVALGRSLGRSEQAQEERGRRVRVCVRCWSPRRGEKGALKCKASSLSAQLRE